MTERIVAALFAGALAAAGGATPVQAQLLQAPAQDNGAIAYGDGWATVVTAPAGWESDCCQRAKERGVNMLVYPHGWDGSGDDRVMQLTVWTDGRATLDADWDADASGYLAHYPGTTTLAFAVSVPGRHCRGAVYAGTERARDYVVFCDAGNDLKFRYAWSMILDDGHADREKLENDFRAVVAHTVPLNATVERRPE